jgi:hypothetical protein
MTFDTAAHARWEDRQLADHLDREDAPESMIEIVTPSRFRDIATGRFVDTEKALEIIEEDARIAGYDPMEIPEYREIAGKE